MIRKLVKFFRQYIVCEIRLSNLTGNTINITINVINWQQVNFYVLKSVLGLNLHCLDMDITERKKCLITELITKTEPELEQKIFYALLPYVKLS